METKLPKARKLADGTWFRPVVWMCRYCGQFNNINEHVCMRCLNGKN